MDNNHEKSRVNSLLPEFLKETSTGIVKFLKEYYENEYDKEFFKSRTENEDYVDVASSLISGITENRDLDRVSEATFIEELSQTVAKNIPASSVVTRKFLIKRLVDYYDARGNIQMIDAFFRLFFNKNVTLFEPWTKVLIPSSGGYNENLFIRTFNNTGNDAKAVVTKRISQKTVGGSIIAEALVSSVTKETYDETITTFNLQKNTLIGNFLPNFDIEDEDGNKYGKPYRTLKSFNIIHGGSNYSVGDLVFIPEFLDATFYARVDSVDDGKVTKLRIISYGSGNTVDSNVSPAIRDFMDASSTDMMHYYETCLGTDGNGTISKKVTTITISNAASAIFNGTWIETIVEGQTRYIQGGVGRYIFFDTATNKWSLQNATTIIDTLPTAVTEADGFWSADDSPGDDWESPNGIDYLVGSTYEERLNVSIPAGLKTTLNFDLLIDEGGRYRDEKGRLSDDIVLQDSNFFQKFSYELASDQEFSQYKSFYVELLHPAGEKPFHNTEKTLPTQKLEVSNEDFKPLNFVPVSLIADDDDSPPALQRINIPGVVFITNQTYFNVDDIGLDSPPAVDKTYIKEDYLNTTLKITY